MKNPNKSGLKQILSSFELQRKPFIVNESNLASLFARLGNKALFIFLLSSVLYLSSCDKEDSAPPINNDPEPTGSILIKIKTTGKDSDPEGYTVHIEGSDARQVDANGEINISNKRPGNYSIELRGIANHCSGNGSMVKEATVSADGITTVEFEVDCKAILRDRLVYSKGLNNFTEFKIHSSNLDGSDEKLIYDKVIAFPSTVRISPDGTKISFNDRLDGNNTIQIFVMDADGENVTAIPHEGADNTAMANQFNSVWHPDSKKITFRNGFRNVTYELESGQRTLIEFEEGEMFSVQEVIDNGTKFLGIYIKNTPGSPVVHQLAISNADGTGMTILKEEPNLVFISAKMLDENTLVYIQRINASGFFNEVRKINIDGSNDQNIQNQLGFAESDRLQSFTISPNKTDLLFYFGRNVNFFFGKTKLNGSVELLTYTGNNVRVSPDWSQVTRK
ncbi:hypothetical protein [Arthrospiribacter ruber]|uniref:Uncharacterized protein n=1 Tax=Arthrospiribacter ruber TaxID=2487934 RepID=A0A951MDW3_9BACT|nr:hypothetical protein [Arthrospiribacter ruber]MBW3468025.1 hypothetical protein [Arthrospiribacter ruber]